MVFEESRFSVAVNRNDERKSETSARNCVAKKYTIDVTNRSAEKANYEIQITNFGADGIMKSKMSYALPGCRPSETTRCEFECWEKDTLHSITGIYLNDIEYIAFNYNLGGATKRSNINVFTFLVGLAFFCVIIFTLIRFVN